MTDTQSVPPHRRPRLLPETVLALIAFCIGSLHVAAGPHLYDAGELTSAAWMLGGSHPPGQPVHALLGRLAAMLPLGPITMRLSLLSLVAEVTAAWLTARIVRELASGLRLNRHLAAGGAFVCVALAPPLVRQAARPEVYGLAIAMTLACAWLLLGWVRSASRDDRPAVAAAFVAGLVACVHPPHALACFLIGFAGLLTTQRGLLRRGRSLAWMTSAFVLGALAVVYLPVRAAAGAPMWGDPTTAAGFVDYVTAFAYRHNLHGTEGSFGATLAEAAMAAGTGTGVVALAGAALVLARDISARKLVEPPKTFLVLAGLLTVLAGSLQPVELRNPDNVAYLAPCVALCVAAGFAGLSNVLVVSRTRPLGMLAVLLAALNLPSLSRVPEALRADAPALETLAGALVDTPPPRALALVRSDFAGSAWMAARDLDGARPDVALFVTGLATSSWHWRSLAGHPCFDGRPVRGRGPDTRSAFVAGAIARALPCTTIANEEGPWLRGAGSLAGPYVEIVDNGGPRIDDAPGERTEATLYRDFAAGPLGDWQAVASVVRQHAITRAHRLVARGRARDAVATLRRASPDLPGRERGAFRVASDTLTRDRLRVVRDPTAFLASSGDVQREAAAILWAAGDGALARRMLAWGASRGEIRHLLQLAVIQLAEGDLQGARHSMQTFVAIAPERASEAQALLASP